MATPRKGLGRLLPNACEESGMEDEAHRTTWWSEEAFRAIPTPLRPTRLWSWRRNGRRTVVVSPSPGSFPETHFLYQRRSIESILVAADTKTTKAHLRTLTRELTKCGWKFGGTECKGKGIHTSGGVAIVEQ